MGILGSLDVPSLVGIVASDCKQMVDAWGELERRGFGSKQEDLDGLCSILRSCPCQCVRVKAQKVLNRLNDRLRDERATVAA